MNKVNKGHMYNFVDDLNCLHAFRVKGRPKFRKDPVSIFRRCPPPGWTKCNVDDNAHGCPGQIRGSAVHRNSREFFMGAFTASFGWSFAYEAELSAALTAAYDKDWNRLWLETYSTYVLHILQILKQ